MTYSMIINRQHSDPSYVNDIKAWTEVIEYLRNKLDQWVTSVQIYKFSSNGRCLGEKCVMMGNLWDVANSSSDKILL